MKFLLDTNAIIAILKGKSTLIDQLKRHKTADFGLSAIVLDELRYGASKSSRPKENHTRIDALRFEIIPFDTEDARKVGDIRASLATAGTPIGAYDVLIAGQSLARDLTLITREFREFKRVENLRIENWEGYKAQ